MKIKILFLLMMWIMPSFGIYLKCFFPVYYDFQEQQWYGLFCKIENDKHSLIAVVSTRGIEELFLELFKNYQDFFKSPKEVHNHSYFPLVRSTWYLMLTYVPYLDPTTLVGPHETYPNETTKEKIYGFEWIPMNDVVKGDFIENYSYVGGPFPDYLRTYIQPKWESLYKPFLEEVRKKIGEEQPVAIPSKAKPTILPSRKRKEEEKKQIIIPATSRTMPSKKTLVEMILEEEGELPIQTYPKPFNIEKKLWKLRKKLENLRSIFIP